VLIRTRVHEIREMGRNTQGVTLIQLDEGETLAGLEKLLESEDDEPKEQDANGEPPAPLSESP
jgi:DNA gyrase subunit A